MTEPYLARGGETIYLGDAVDVLADMPDGAFDAVVTSPPYLDQRPEVPAFVAFDALFAQLVRVVDGPAVFNVGRVWRDKRELRWWEEMLDAAERAGWPLLDTGIWVKPNANPIHGYAFANSHEYLFVLGQPGATINEDAIRTEYAPASIPRLRRKWVKGRGVKGDISDAQSREENELGARGRSFFVAYVGREKGNPHPSPMALEVAEYLVSLVSREGQAILDPFGGSGTTLVAARRLGRHATMIDLSEDFCELAARRLEIPEAIERAAVTATEPIQLALGAENG